MRKRRRAQLSGRWSLPEPRSVQRFAETENTARNLGVVFSMQLDRNNGPEGRERARAGR